MKRKKQALSFVMGLATAVTAGCVTSFTEQETVSPPTRYRIEQVRIAGKTMFIACSNCPAPTPKVLDEGQENTVPKVSSVEPPPSHPETVHQTPENQEEKINNQIIYGELLNHFNSMAVTKPSGGDVPSPASKSAPKIESTVDSPAQKANATPTKTPEIRAGQYGVNQPLFTVTTPNKPEPEEAPRVNVTEPVVKPKAAPSAEMETPMVLAVKGSDIEKKPLLTIDFAFDSTELSAQTKFSIHSLSPEIKRAQEINVTGYTCSAGAPAYNKYLALRRALSVARELEEAGIMHTQIRTQGKGNCCYVASNDTPEDRQKNRRVEIVITPATPVQANAETVTGSVAADIRNKTTVAGMVVAGLPNRQR